MRWYAEGTWLIAGTRTVGHGMLHWLETFVTTAGVGRHGLMAMNWRVNVLSGASSRNCTNENKRSALRLLSRGRFQSRTVPQLRRNLLLETGADETEGKTIKYTGTWGNRLFCLYFRLFDCLVLCHLYNLILSEQAQVTLQLTIFSNYCKNF